MKPGRELERRVTSSLPTGSIMPAEPPKFPDLIVGCSHEPIREASMPRVLVVDDQTDVRTMISIVLRIHHFEIVEAASAASALKLFEEASFDLAIVDIFLQGTNGSDLITTLRTRVPGLPVIAISGMIA